MFRLAAPLLVSALANDETSLMQGLKPAQVSQKEDKSKAISNLLQSATQMLKNGATEDVVVFAEATLTEITDVVLPAIEDASRVDQELIYSTHRMFDRALEDLETGTNRINRAREHVSEVSAQHKACRAEEETTCGIKRDCDYDLWAIWRRFKDEESTMRQYSTEISNHFCAEDANGTMWIFRDHSVTVFPPFIEQKPVVEHWEAEYGGKIGDCETKFTNLDDKTAECDALQLRLEQDTCSLANDVIQVRNQFAMAWAEATWHYQRVMDEVHCLEIDRWKEWRTLASIQCLLTRTRERNGRPCEETTEITQEVTECEETQTLESIDHLRIDYPHVPPFPYIPEIPFAPCSPGFIEQEYAELWIPPQPEFHSPSSHAPLSLDGNSHCNQRPECSGCDLEPEVPQCGIFHTGIVFDYPMPEHECHTGTRQQLIEGEFDLFGDGHWDPVQITDHT